MIRRTLALAALALAGCAHVGGPAPQNGTSAPPTAPTPTPIPVHVVSSGNGRVTTLTEMKERRRLYTIRAASFVADSTDEAGGIGNGTFQSPQITFFGRDGSSMTATAPKAVLTGADKSVLMTGGVRARSQDGNVLRCDRLRYDGRTERVHGDGHVTLMAPNGLVLSGDTVDGDARLQHVTVRRGAAS
jgi:LPS export ABC transporter protein LptC